MRRYTQQDKTAVQQALSTHLASLSEHIRGAMSESEQVQFNAVLGRSTGDSSDEALAITLGDLSSARLNMEIRQWQALKAAEQRLATPEFGECVECGEPIPVARLLVNPAAQRCIACQTAFEQTHAGHGHGSL